MASVCIRCYLARWLHRINPSYSGMQIMTDYDCGLAANPSYPSPSLSLFFCVYCTGTVTLPPRRGPPVFGTNAAVTDTRPDTQVRKIQFHTKQIDPETIDVQRVCVSPS